MTGIRYYNYDNCYKATEIINDNCLNTFLRNNFDIQTVKLASECGNESIKKSAEYFLMSDLCNNTQRSNCYIPKNIGSTVGDILQPLRDMFGDNLDNDYDYSTTPALGNLDKPSLVSNDDLYIDDTNKCLKYSVDNKVYAPKRNFALYKSSNIDVDKLYLAQSIKSYNYYENKLNNLKEYENLLKIPQNLSEDYNPDAGSVYNSFKDYICNPNDNNKSFFKEQINNIDAKYSSLVNALSEISSDLSAINILSENAGNTISAIELQIDNKKKELDDLFGFGGANNGKLGDINYMKNIKIFEITILILVIITIIILINKK